MRVALKGSLNIKDLVFTVSVEWPFKIKSEPTLEETKKFSLPPFIL